MRLRVGAEFLFGEAGARAKRSTASGRPRGKIVIEVGDGDLLP
ncbi:MAG TPA: hypothetical protein VMS01_08170 [Stellaceae bacterium]|nr:hypothetical protein [Stellaceae bacterium]